MEENKIKPIVEIVTEHSIPKIFVESTIEDIKKQMEEIGDYLTVTTTDRMHYVLPKRTIRIIACTKTQY